MKTRKTKTVHYALEICDGFRWEEDSIFDKLEDARNEMFWRKKSLPTCKFRIIKVEWEVIESD
jgi:hypothetical protein